MATKEPDKSRPSYTTITHRADLWDEFYRFLLDKYDLDEEDINDGDYPPKDGAWLGEDPEEAVAWIQYQAGEQGLTVSQSDEDDE